MFTFMNLHTYLYMYIHIFIYIYIYTYIYGYTYHGRCLGGGSRRLGRALENEWFSLKNCRERVDHLRSEGVLPSDFTEKNLNLKTLTQGSGRHSMIFKGNIQVFA